jgi:hypothetical protein
MEAPSTVPTALAAPRMNRRRETAALSTVWRRNSGEKIVWLDDLRVRKDAARPEEDWGFITVERIGPRAAVKVRMDEF